MKSKCVKSMVAFTMTAALVSGIGMATNAAENPVNWTLTINKTWEVADQNHYDPNEAFEFTLTYVSADKVGTNPIGSVTYDQKIVKPGETESFATISVGGEGQWSGEDTTYKASKAFEKVTFGGPGLYRFQVKETVGTNANIKYDENTYNLLVPVVYGSEGQLKVENVLNKGVDGSATEELLGMKTENGNTQFPITNSNYANSDNPDEKTVGITVSNENEGEAANPNDVFQYTVLLEAPDGKLLSGSYSVIYQGTQKGNPTTIGKGTFGKYEATITLGNGENFQVVGLPNGTKVTVTDGSNGYTASYVVDDNGKVIQGTSFADTISKNTVVAFTNTKGLAPLTGVAVEILPYALLLAIAVGGMGLFIISKRNNKVK